MVAYGVVLKPDAAGVGLVAALDLATVLLEVNSIALLKSQQTFQQTFQHSFYSSVGHPVVLETLLKSLLKSLLRFQQSY